MLENVTRPLLRADPGRPVLCPGDQVIADVGLSLSGIKVPLAVLGDAVLGHPPAPGRVRVPATADEIGRALLASEVVIADGESTPVAILSELAISSPDAGWIEGRLHPVGPEPLGLPARVGGSRVVVVPGRPLTAADLKSLRALEAEELVLVVPTAGPTPDGIPADVLGQCLAKVVPNTFTVLPLPVHWRGTDVDHALALAVTAGLEGTHLWHPKPATGRAANSATEPADRRWSDVLDAVRQATTEPATSTDRLLAAVLPILTHWRPPRQYRGLVVFFTGYSGSGKSTLAKALADQLAATTDRKVTLLDGDLVRRMLSSGLGFDRSGRDLNVRRIGFVAAEVARHGGIAVCAPIAPYAESRAAVRAMVEAVGDLVLVHVATPLEECERRDVKGLYRKARAGVVTQFTGISDPYDEPLDAEIRVDTTQRDPAETLAVITGYLTRGGWLGGTDQAPGG
ncbi:sulfate adenylyltransferase [Kribbella amoyensis]|uniref:adenylyl-sulfate kinase n=1 Tax=Kribbella amoyensis TaxID=996641 RepID=A0A561BWP1_9ACTN|nr:adenylyl-sulfate kinase [Kribbella amoyensis]TWD83291.1 sulfate adenylyltransferase [Kribbella amoyensis]